MQTSKNYLFAHYWPLFKQAHFHWFWGLSLKKNQYEGSLGEQATILLNDLNAYNTMIAKQEAIHRYNTIVRWVYWLFNINDYTRNGFVILACNSYLASHQDCQLSSHQMEYKMPLLSSATQSFSFSQWWDNSVHELIKCFNTKDAAEENHVETNSTNMCIEHEQHKVGTTFIIYPQMQTHLHFFEIEQNIGDLIDWDKVKNAYHKKVLRTHPDKGGSEEAFRQVQASYETLKELIFPENKHHAISHFSGASAEMAATRLDAIVAEAEIILSEAKKCSEEAMDSANRTMDSANRTMDSANRTMDSANRTMDSANRTMDSANRAMDNVNRAMDSVNRAMDSVNEITALVANMQRLNQSSLKTPRAVDFSLRNTLPITRIEFDNKKTYSPLFYPLPIRDNFIGEKNKQQDTSMAVIVYRAPLF